MRIAVIGATGRIGQRTVAALRRAGHEPVPISRSTGVDVVTGDGLDAALTGVDAVIDVTNTATADPGHTIEFFRTATTKVLAAERRAGVGHHVLLSIVGVDKINGNAHYLGKRAQEELVEQSDLPSTIVRATQFFDFPLLVASWTSDGDRVTLPPLLMQPISPDDVADVLAEVGAGAPVHRIDIAGPETQDLVDMARRSFAARGELVRIVPAWTGMFGVEMAGNALLPGPDARLAPTTFDEWLASGGSGDP